MVSPLDVGGIDVFHQGLIIDGMTPGFNKDGALVGRLF
jgi:hypothetical protein